MLVRLRMISSALMLLIGAVGIAMAEPSFPARPTDALPASEGGTYLDLLRRVMPGIVVDGIAYSGARPVAIRQIDGSGEGTVEPTASGQLNLTAVPLRSGGMERMALLIDFGTAEHDLGAAILALFDIAGEPLLLDAADIAMDRHTSFRNPVRLSVSAGDDLLVSQSMHFNSNQYYAIANLILVRDDRFELVDTIAMLSDQDCAFERSQSLMIEQGTGKPVADIVATVTERTTLTAEDCGGRVGPEPGSRTVAVTYRWDPAAQRYEPDSDAFTALARENEERF